MGKKRDLPLTGATYWECECGYSNNTDACWWCREPKKPAAQGG